MSYTFISGSSGGIGKALAKECAINGYDLFLTGRSQAKLSSLKIELLAVNNKINIEYFACDLTSETARKEMIEYIDSGKIIFDRIINVAGVDTQKAFVDYTMEKLLFQIRVNVEATISITHSLLSRRAKNMEIITISSMSGVTPMPYFAIYSASKNMLTSFFTSLRLELKSSGVKVTTVLPGGVYTRADICQDIIGQGVWGKLSAKTPEYVAKKSLSAVKKNKSIYIPGFFNKFLNAIMKIVPRAISMRFIANRWKKQTKDAF